MKRMLLFVPLLAALPASAEYQYIIDAGVRPERPTPVLSSGAVSASDVAGAMSRTSASGGAGWLYARWCEFTDYIRVRRDKFSGMSLRVR